MVYCDLIFIVMYILYKIILKSKLIESVFRFRVYWGYVGGNYLWIFILWLKKVW